MLQPTQQCYCMVASLRARDRQTPSQHTTGEGHVGEPAHCCQAGGGAQAGRCALTVALCGCGQLLGALCSVRAPVQVQQQHKGPDWHLMPLCPVCRGCLPPPIVTRLLGRNVDVPDDACPALCCLAPFTHGPCLPPTCAAQTAAPGAGSRVQERRSAPPAVAPSDWPAHCRWKVGKFIDSRGRWVSCLDTKTCFMCASTPMAVPLDCRNLGANPQGERFWVCCCPTPCTEQAGRLNCP